MLAAGHEPRTRCSSSPAGSWSASARSCSSATGGRRSRTPTPPSRRSSPTASATSACIVGMIILFFAAGQTFDIVDDQRRWPSAARSATSCCSSASCSLLGRGHVEVGPVHPPHLAARRHGRPHAGVGPHPRRHHGRGRHLHGRPPLRRVLRGPLDRRRRASTSSPSSAASRCIGGAGLAFVQNDIKKVLAYSTVSQLGYMVMALGVGAWTAAIFHLFTHAFFKAGLFLGSGSVAHAVHSLRHEGGHGRAASSSCRRPSGPS